MGNGRVESKILCGQKQELVRRQEGTLRCQYNLEFEIETQHLHAFQVAGAAATNEYTIVCLLCLCIVYNTEAAGLNYQMHVHRNLPLPHKGY